MRVDNILVAVSRGFDIIEAELAGVASGHSQRVAALCNSMAETLGMSDDERITLSVCALFHDSALTEWIVSGDENKDHCVMGQRNIDTLPLPTNPEGIVLYHHERSDGTGFFGLHNNFPIAAEIISIADDYDKGLALNGFSPRLVDALRNATDAATLPKWELPPVDAMKLGNLIAKAVDYKSRFTRHHTIGIAEKAKQMARFYGYDIEETAKLYLAACLHDIGKIATPTTVLEKPGKLTSDEFEVIKNHALQTHILLEGVDDDIKRWAAGHHEKLDGSGYPFGLKAEDLDFNTRLVACIDIYQAVSEERPYHPARSHNETMKVLYSMAANGVIDKTVARDLEHLEGQQYVEKSKPGAF